ncbi:hypothetical protein CLV92_109102 [Kineococcus xinjiangensis]|uniref:Uncharacterized protein n=1 Tax=Kineococcus xinjiangensis TaxID=512762 RepID=A0A2S6II11_9ACTN|nr:hypothetical protein [Kineococcus xinjiangensis]PPK93825.1 hypothetical protein CLV92_109102 [Kineococcus xinjiangensis]
MLPVHVVLRDLERASLRGELTPTFIDDYASKFGERVTALYALARKNHIAVNVEEGRNDHLLNEWESTVDVDAVTRAMDKQSVEAFRQLRAARQDDRPSVLRRKPGRHAAFVPKPAPQPVAPVQRCPPGCTCDLDHRPSRR